ncbi:actinodin1 [Hippocampus zosterae]|uniref:actinodin1 n=1 Tax=Hippocampus zosterae TaxID=109293 RepID=UPI00223CCB8F|nr:actinodin1 [Hippocampus zosterae]
MAAHRRTGLSGVLVAATLAVVIVLLLLPADVSAGPVAGKATPDAGESIRARAEAAAAHRRLSRNRRNISWYKQHSDFWSWYKYFTDNGNQEAVQELDRIYLTYLQNKNRAEGRRSYKAYLRHLGEIYKSCADSDDPNCVASYTSRAKPEPPKPAPVKTCDPTKDAYCLYAALVARKSPYMPLVLPAQAPAPVKSPAPLFVRPAAAAKEPQSGYYYYAPSSVSFLSKEQKAELLRVCGAEDVECLQYHLRAAYGYPPTGGSSPAYAHLGCDPTVDPTCKPQKASSGLYQYPNCDPLRDPYCAYLASPMAPRVTNPPSGSGSCNPIFEDGCNPLTATKFVTPQEAYKTEPSEEAAAIRVPPPAADHYSDPYGMYRDANANANRVTDPYATYRQASAPAAPPADDQYAVLRRFMAQAQGSDPYAPRMESMPESNPNDPFSAMRDTASATMHRHSARQHYLFSPPTYEEPTREERHPLGPPGKTKEGYDCFIGYDRDCFPLQPAEPRSSAHRRIPHPAEAYEPHLKADGTRDGVLEPPNPHCDPEFDRDCRLRRREPEQPRHEDPKAQPEVPEQDPYEAEPYQSGQEEPHVSNVPTPPQGMPSLQDILRSYGDHFSEQEDYRKK